MTIKIDKRSKYSTFVETGNLTIYIEHSPGCAEDFVHVWKKDSTDDSCSIFYTNYDFDNDKRLIEVNNDNATETDKLGTSININSTKKWP